MKYWITGLFISLAFFPNTLGGGEETFKEFEARSRQGSVELWWTTDDETNIRHFIVLRRTPQSTSYIELNSNNPISPQDNKYYQFTDNQISKTSDIVFIYRIKIIYKNNPNPGYSKEISASPTLSVSSRTWGSIKAMFR